VAFKGFGQLQDDLAVQVIREAPQNFLFYTCEQIWR
jgi:hypothetical protein